MTTVFTIGHSNQPAASFDDLLIRQGIERLIDVRSKPCSRFGQYNRRALERRLPGLGIGYLYMGDSLGGYPEGKNLYRNDRVIYERIVSKPEFRRGIKRIVEESERSRLVLMCAQENPENCHRHPLLALALMERDVNVLHLRRDGSVQDAAAIAEQISVQLPLIEPVGEDLTWHSPKPVPRRSHSQK